MLSIFNISSTGINFYKNSLDAIAHNVANVNTVRTMDEGAVRRQSVVGTADTSPVPSMIGTGGTVGGGVSFKVVQSSSAVGLVTYDPENVLANADGYVRRPDIDLTTEMADKPSGGSTRDRGLPSRTSVRQITHDLQYSRSFTLHSVTSASSHTPQPKYQPGGDSVWGHRGWWCGHQRRHRIGLWI